MKSKMVILTALAALVATPALAQNSPPTNRSVISAGRIVGTDPDVQVRFELERDAPTYLGGN